MAFPAAVDYRGYRRLLCRPRSWRPITSLRLLRGGSRPAVDGEDVYRDEARRIEANVAKLPPLTPGFCYHFPEKICADAIGLVTCCTRISKPPPSATRPPLRSATCPHTCTLVPKLPWSQSLPITKQPIVRRWRAQRQPLCLWHEALAVVLENRPRWVNSRSRLAFIR
jgi:hypothetical protein